MLFPFCARYFRFIGYNAPVTHRDLGFCFKPSFHEQNPLDQIYDPQKTFGSILRPKCLLQTLWLLTKPLRAHSIGKIV